MESSAKQKFVCHFFNCEKSFGKSSRLIIHERTHTGERPFKCDESGCNKSFTRKFHLTKHAAVSHSTSTEEFKCTECHKVYGNSYSLQTHMNTIHKKIGKYVCEVCGKRFVKANQFKCHSAEHTGIHPFQCAHCEKAFLRSSDLKKHERRHIDGRFKCSFEGCPLKYSSYSELRHHLAMDHLKDCNREKTSSGSELNFKCPEPGCCKSFGKESRLIVHRRTHTGERPFKCTFHGCSSSYTRKVHLERHMLVTHSFLESSHLEAVCDICDKSFANKHSLVKHKKRTHDAERFVCDICHKGFKKAQHLQYHSSVHTGLKPRACTYPGCNYTCEFPRSLKRHEKIHQGERFLCTYDDCNERFDKCNDLRRHLKLGHVKVCEVCGAEFSQLSNLKSHLPKHSESREAYFCPYRLCEKYFLHKKNIKSHIVTVHDPHFQGFHCPLCDKFLVTKQKMKLHMVLHDPNERASLPKVSSGVRKPRKDKGSSKVNLPAHMSGWDSSTMAGETSTRADGTGRSSPESNKTMLSGETATNDAASLVTELGLSRFLSFVNVVKNTPGENMGVCLSPSEKEASVVC